MRHLLPSPLPLFDRNLLRAVEKVVPSAEREEWSRTWQAELWHMHHRRRNHRSRNHCISALGITTDLSIGLTRDALWLRTDSWRRTFTGTPILCLASLLGLCFFSTLISLALNGNWHSLCLYLSDPFKRSLLEAPLVVFVAFATASRRHIEQKLHRQKTLPDQATNLLRRKNISRFASRISAKRRHLPTHPRALASHFRPASGFLLRPLRACRPALGLPRSGATLQAVLPLACDTRACRPPLAQSP